MKGEEARVAMEELIARQQQVVEGEAPDERALMNQIVQLERELRERDGILETLRDRGSSPTPGAVNELRVLRQENEDLRVRLILVERCGVQPFIETPKFWFLAPCNACKVPFYVLDRFRGFENVSFILYTL